MKELQGLILMGKRLKTSSARLGGYINLSGRSAYLINEHRSIIIKTNFQREVGTGNFKANEAPPNAERVQRRGDRVLFQWEEGSAMKRVFVPNKRDFVEKSKHKFDELWREPTTRIPSEFIDSLNSDIIITDLELTDGKILAKQKRGDGSVEIQNAFPVGSGIMQSLQGGGDEGSLSVFTADLRVFRGIADNIMVSIEEGKPMSLSCDLSFGKSAKALISFLEYRR